MSDYDKTSFEHRLKVAEFRSRLTTQVISIALLINAIPISVKVLFDLPRYEDEQLFWFLLFAGWLSACFAIAFGLLFESLAPRWARDGPIDTFRALAMDIGYTAALVCIGVSAISFTGAIAYAVLGGFNIAD